MNLSSHLRFVLLILLAIFLSGCADSVGDSNAIDRPDGTTFADGAGSENNNNTNTNNTTGENNNPGGCGPDSDVDGISDADEGADQNIDTDGDGAPDYIDADSDNDGIADVHEAGDSDLCSPPVDSDGDGIPDFRETDSDNDTISDSIEAGDGDPNTTPIDTDGDGIADFQDIDSDGDGIADSVEVGDDDPNTPPVDFDGDGTPDYLDIDSDGDTIGDAIEGSVDTDGDGILDRFDDDSDGDGILDADETDGNNPPRDSDGDGIYDFRELDSDNDGLTDADEINIYGTDPTLRDTDGDGAPDLVEIYAETDALDPESNPKAQGDFFFVIPYEDLSYPAKDTINFKTSVQLADLYFGFDASLSMNEEYTAMRDPQSGVPAIVEALTCEYTTTSCLKHHDCKVALGEGFVCSPKDLCMADPLDAGCVADLWTGVGKFGNIDSFQNLLAPQPNPNITASSIPVAGESARVDGLLLGPWAEAPYHAATCVADGSECFNNDKNCAPGVGCPGFREEAVRIYVQISDADDQCVNPPYESIGYTTDFADIDFGVGRCADFDAATAGAALAEKSIRFIGLYGNPECDFALADCDDYPDAAYNDWLDINDPSRTHKAIGTPETVALGIGGASGSVDSSGSPFVYEALDAVVVDRTVEAVRDMLQKSSLRVDIVVTDLNEGPSDTIDGASLIHHFAVQLGGPGCTNTAAEDGNGNGYIDTFSALFPGEPACWDVFPIEANTIIPATDQPQVFKARVTISGDGSPLDRRDIFFLIPAKIPEIGIH